MTKHYTVVCKCGQPYGVRTSEAGDIMKCRLCRRQLEIPRLLRTTEQVIQSMVRFRDLPANDQCPLSGQRATATVSILIEDVPAAMPGIMHSLAAIVASSLGHLGTALEIDAKRAEEKEANPRKSLAIVPLRVSGHVIEQLSVARQKTLVNALRIVPIYAHLLDEYPNAYLTVLSHDRETPRSQES